MSAHPLPETAEEASGFLDHTLLDPLAGPEDVERHCAEALALGCYGVCVAPWLLPAAVRVLKGSKVLPMTVIGFPLGVCDSTVKAHEAARAVDEGARELDMVINLGALACGEVEHVRADVAAVVAAARGRVVKAIVETRRLTDEQKTLAAQTAVRGGASFVKTCTGFGPGAATVDDVALLRAAVGWSVGVKASGGVKSAEDMLALIRAGADRIGASASRAILEGFPGA